MHMESLSNFIDGQFCPPTSKEHFESFNPATGKPIHLIPDSDAADVEMAVKAAQAAYPSWSKSSREYRCGLLNKVADLLEENLEQFGTNPIKDRILNVCSPCRIQRSGKDTETGHDC